MLNILDKVINGRDLAREIKKGLSVEVSKLKEKGVNPHLTVIIVGDDAASKAYVNGKIRASDRVGISSEIITLPSEVSEEELLKEIDTLNKDDSVHGILVQLPLPEHIKGQTIIESINPKKDVDGFNPINIGKMIINQDTFLPCTPYGIITMLKSRNIEIEGKHAVIVGRSNIVGKPVGQMLLNENATVTYCHSKTKNLKKFTQQADILVVAVGQANSIDSSHIKDGAVVIDVGINRLDNGKLTGDVDFDDVIDKVSFVTPVPGGVGPMTIAMLLKNTVKAATQIGSNN